MHVSISLNKQHLENMIRNNHGIDYLVINEYYLYFVVFSS